MYQDVAADLADVAAVSVMAQGMTSLVRTQARIHAETTLTASSCYQHSPCPRATWDSDEFKSRVAFIRATQDAAIPLEVQQMMLDGTGVEWIVKDIESGHSPQLSQPEKLTAMTVELVKGFEAL
jgi:pimeloyl-ACP methyl ester carboxylesterase